MKRLLPCLLLLACGGTERTRRTFPVEVSGSTAGLLTDSGWSVTLSQARLHLEALRFFEGKVVLARAQPWWRSVLVSTAWAHPGHYVPGEALGELVQPLDVDLLATTATAWGTASAVTGEYGSAQVTLGGAGLELVGVATRGAALVEFSAQFAPPAALEGVRFEHVMGTAPGVVQAQLDLQAVLARVDFAQVGASAKPLDASSPAFNGLARGVEDTSAWLISWKEN